ncbi:Na(+)/dicarboxylate symporter [Aggregatibacter actinomycetemcomitans]|uniref:SLC13 family permease n=1 Tax=Aggregatibacter actinomycetemcomitans TaxID=714 RepID=UPI00022ACFBC|nr:SLC13 family permease [Aggregatibacter actinomycetemcomitans]KOE59680.1 citrate transporter [Aggregatibacter actinomycetemcomitans serotype c str. SCC2302]KOE60232.1 citrate transporter [Aggregatibacter actinomycetemcomitans serotype c str. AAS4A]KYK74559.1 citrate transporter [Aggregatibacter actinomycetemcomitans serotype e str. SA2149]MCE3057878.1 SLC13 family permease [Aggregatibacter actinomycetemcomitans]TYA13903.1 SLC13 family permease [Aggregatibacter actinomycetemcomitans]
MSQISHFFNSFQPEPWLWVVLLLIAAVILFIRNHIRMDIVAVLVMLAFSLSGILTVEEVFAGFSDPNIILIALLFIVGEGLVRTGVAYQVSEWLLKASHNSESRVLVFMMLAVAGLGAFMSSTGVVAIFIPVVLMICQQMNISPKRLMMPLSVAGLISGMLTLIATAPNLVVNAELVREAGMRLKFFDLTPIGLVILLLGIGYMLVARRWLKSGTKADNNKLDKRSISDLIHEYGLQLRAQRFVVKKGSAIIGKNLDELHLRSKYGLNVLAIERWKRFRPLFIAALGTSEVREKDILLMDISDPELDIETFCTEYNLERAEIRAQYFSEQASSIGMAELILVPNSDCIGKSTEQLRFRSKYDLNVVGIKRDGEVLDGHFVEMPYKAGDLLLVVGDWKLIQQMRSHSKDFFVLNYPSEITRAVPAQSQAPYALLSIAVMVLLMVTRLVPNVVAALIACLMLGYFRCVDSKSAYESIHWSSLVLIVGMMPFSLALQRTGGVSMIVDLMLHLVGGMGKHWILISLFILTAVVGLFISNTATAILIAPIAITMAHQLNLSPVPFAMVVAIAASAAFMTPVSSPVNTMVFGPGGYKFADFVKVGVPFTLLVMLVSVFLIPFLFPFNP